MTAKSAFFNILQSLCVLCVYLGVCMCVRGQVFVHVDVSPHFAPRLRKDLLFAAASTRLAGLWVPEESPVFASHLVDKIVGLADMPALPCLPSMSVLGISTQVAMLVEQAFPTPHLSKAFLLYGKSISVNTMGRGWPEMLLRWSCKHSWGLGSTPPDLSAAQWQLPPWESTLLPMLALCQNSADIELGGYHYVWAKKT